MSVFVTPFGIKNSPSVFQRLVMQALGDRVNSYVIVYMDDIMITASTQCKALKRLQIALDVLTEAGLSFNITHPCRLRAELVLFHDQ